jgi:hypothetical protein
LLEVNGDERPINEITPPYSGLYNDEHWANLERLAVNALLDGLSEIRRMTEGHWIARRRRPSTYRRIANDAEQLYRWLRHGQYPAERSTRQRLRSLAKQVDLRI